MTTTADEKIHEAKKSIDLAIKQLLVVVDEDTWGYRDLGKEYINIVFEAMIELHKIKQKL